MVTVLLPPKTGLSVALASEHLSDAAKDWPLKWINCGEN
jgi:hypothetical protein